MERSIVKPPRRKDKIGPFETVDFVIFAMSIAGIAWPILEISGNIFMFVGGVIVAAFVTYLAIKLKDKMPHKGFDHFIGWIISKEVNVPTKDFRQHPTVIRLEKE